jgi:hypothetical protein
MLLGHTNSKITEKHYAPWVRARQEQLEADVRWVWEQLASDSLESQPLYAGIRNTLVNYPGCNSLRSVRPHSLCRWFLN